MDGPNTDSLLHGLAAGDERAFAALYDRFAGRMYRTALRMLGRKEDAEDVVQEVFLATVRSRKRLREVRDLTAYLFAALHRAAGRCAVQRARLLQLSPKDADDVAMPRTQDASEDPDWNRLQKAIQSLPTKQRETLTLKIDGELTFAQIARVMGVSVGTAASRYQYALKKLKASLAPAKPLSEESR